ncbi:MAG: hydrogenase 3 maturation endopeptidase HyCI [Candidatus Bathyarchaeota archaeon]
MTDFKEQSVEIELKLKEWFSNAKRVVIAGIGNPFRKDDFVGVKIIRRLRKKVPESVYLIEAETIPESYMQQIESFKPTHILLIDAGIINKPPGTIELANPKQLIRKTSISTHTLPLRIFCDYLTQTTAAKIGILIIQPFDTRFGEGLTPEIEKVGSKIAKLLQKLLPQ